LLLLEERDSGCGPGETPAGERKGAAVSCQQRAPHRRPRAEAYAVIARRHQRALRPSGGHEPQVGDPSRHHPFCEGEPVRLRSADAACRGRGLRGTSRVQVTACHVLIAPDPIPSPAQSTFPAPLCKRPSSARRSGSGRSATLASCASRRYRARDERRTRPGPHDSHRSRSPRMSAISTATAPGMPTRAHRRRMSEALV
jgi:hypothetical protein